MHVKRITIITGLALFAALIGCSQNPIPTALTPGGDDGSTTEDGLNKTASTVLINNYNVDFDGRTLVDGNTVFAWTVTGTGIEPALSHFMVQLPECAPAPVAFSPSNSVSINSNPNTGIYGVEWHLHVEADDSVGRQYTLTFPGDVPLGEVYTSVISGDETGVGIIPGPCQGYDISGRVFVDANENGLRDPDEESGIAGVIIEFVDALGNIQTVATDASGDYTYRKLSGTFTVNLPLSGYSGYFNGDLEDSFDPTTALTLTATVPPDAPGNDFGFSPRSDEIILDLETGILLTDGETLRFWKGELRSAAGNGNGNHDYDAAALLGFLGEIEDLFLTAPYAFTPGNELQEAYDILRSNSHDPVDELLAELLATELNHVAGRGLIDQADLQLVLIAWGEALIAEAWAAEPGKAGGNPDKRPSQPAEDPLNGARDLFESINTGGGGGVDE